MQYLVLALVLAVLAIAAAACRPGTGTGSASGPSGTAAPAAAPAEAGPGSRADVAARLAALARDPAPDDLAPGAMCYEMVGPPDRAEYVCPTCGEKTLYASTEEDDARASRAGSEVPACRRLASEVRDLNVRLDESAFCEKCRPGVATPRLALVVRYPDGREVRTEGVNSLDLTLLVEFTTGSRKHDGGMQGEIPLKEYLPRLQALLGVDPAEAK